MRMNAMSHDESDGGDKVGSNARKPWTWREWLLWGAVMVVCALLAVALLLPASRSSPQAARYARCRNNLQRITQAMLRYGEIHGSLPPPFTRGPDGTPLHSWRTLILPYLGEEKLFSAIDLSKPWDDPANARARRSMPDVYACPSSQAPAGRTTYMVVVAPESCFPAEGQVALEDLAEAAPETLLVGDFSWRYAVDWMAPQDTDMESWLGVGQEDVTNHGGDFFSLGALDGRTRGIDLESLDAERRRAWITTTDEDDRADQP
jgi:hypothetical protein